MLDLSEEIDRLWRYLEHTDNASKFRREASEWRQRTDTLRKELETHLLKISQQTSQYMTAAAVLGYAGYFTIWSFTSTSLSDRERAVVGLCGLISLSIYVLWEIAMLNLRFKGIAQMGSLLRDLVDPETFEERRSQIVSAEARAARMAMPIWRTVVTFTILLLLTGASVMAHSMYLDLWGVL